MEPAKQALLGVEWLKPSIDGACPQLDRDAHLGSHLSQAPLHDIARAQFFANDPQIVRLVGVPQRRTARDHSQIGVARQTRHDVLGQSTGQRGKVGVVANVFERQHRDPESFLGANRTRV